MIRRALCPKIEYSSCPGVQVIKDILNLSDDCAFDLLNKKTRMSNKVDNPFIFSIVLMPSTAVVWSFFGDENVVGMAFTHSGVGDFYKFSFLKGFDICSTAVTHSCF